ncbi:MAG TPA: ATP-binding protein [Microbacterium sp.]|nr:ATP-binding protein [Microbacterium sp.]
MLPSPYTPGDLPRVFVGRDRERDLLKEPLARVIAFGEMGGPLAIVTGPRGLGKTSLLREVASLAESEGFITAWISGLKHQPFLSELVDQIARALRRAGIEQEQRRTRLESLTLEVGIGLAKVGAKIATTSGSSVLPAPGLLGPLEELLHESSTAIRDQGGAGLLIVIDELHAPLESRGGRDATPEPAPLIDAAALLNVIQNMGGDRRRYPLAIIGAGLPQTKTALTHAATFGERVKEIVLSGFDKQASEALLTEAARPLGVTWAEDARALAVERAAGYPQALQIVGDAAWRVAAPVLGGVVRREHVEAALPIVDEAMGSMFRTRWEVATDHERSVLRAMADIDGERVERGELAARLGVASDDLGMVRRSLIQKGIIEPAGRGLLRFTIPGFDDFVREQ